MRSKKTETHNNLLILSRKWKLAVIFDIFIILALILTIYILINQNFTKIKYVEFGKKDNYAFRVLTSTIANEEKQLLIKQYLRDYVKFRESYEYGKKIDKRIVEKIRAISSDKVFKSYEVLQKTRDKISTFNKREIVILQDIEIENGRSHHVRYKTIDHYNGEKYENDVRWKFGTPPVGNANYAWLQHMMWKLKSGGQAGIVLANGSMSSNTSGEGNIRETMIKGDVVEVMISLPDSVYYFI